MFDYRRITKRLDLKRKGWIYQNVMAISTGKMMTKISLLGVYTPFLHKT
jgi:hypothetical protein